MKYLASMLAALILVVCYRVDAQWVNTGFPTGTTFYTLTVSGSDIFAGSDSGIYLSTNNGTSSTKVNTGLTYPPVRALAVSGTDIFAGGGGGVFLSTNNGTSWTAVNSGLTNVNVYGFAVSGTNIFAASDSGVFLSTNNGTSWTPVNNGLTYYAQVKDLAVSGTNIFAGTSSGGVFLSTNNGTTWTAVNTGLTNTNVFALGVSGTNIFAGTNGGVFLSTNNGTNWSAVNTGLPNTNVFALGVFGTDIFAGTTFGVYLSTNNGTSWTELDNGLTSPYVNALAVSGTNLFAGTNGVYKLDLTIPVAPTLLLPNNSALNVDSSSLGISWGAVTNAASYRLQVSTDSLFSAIVFDNSTINSPSTSIPHLTASTQYYWHVSAANVIGNNSPFSPAWSFVTIVPPPTLFQAIPGNRKVNLSWNKAGASNIAKYRIYRGTTNPASTLIDSTTALAYLDSGLVNGTQYYYRLSSVNALNIEGPGANASAKVFNTPPKAAALSDYTMFNLGRILKTPLTFTSAGSSDVDGTVDSIFWYINGTFLSSQPSINYDFGPGTNRIMLVVKDNDGATDTSRATVNRSAFKVLLNGPVYAGPSLLGSNVLYVIGTGDAVYRLDSTGNDLYSLQVGGDVKSSTSISSDTTVYIASSDKNLYAFSKFGTSLWPALPLGGTMTSTPAVDSITNSLYVGVSNKNFFAVNRTTGTIAWNYFVDAPIVGSAAITLDRKLVVATVKGTVYGFDLTALSSSPTPSWQISLSDSILGSPAIDADGNIYYCTASGKVDKIMMPANQQASTVWQAQVGGSITGSPVIDGNGNLFVGAADGKLYAIDIQSGNVKWNYPSGGPIYSTPTVSDIDLIYFGNHGGEVFAIDTSEVLHWYYQDSTSVDAPLLYSNGVLYAGTIGGRLIAFYDDADSSVLGSTAHVSSKAASLNKVTSVPRAPVWGTFQGNNQRTGTPVGKVITGVNAHKNEIPDKFDLSQNYPNPFNPSTKINYQMPVRSLVTLKVYDIIGREVATLVNEEKNAGQYEITFDGSGLSSGVYFYRIQAGTYVNTRKLLLLK